MELEVDSHVEGDFVEGHERESVAETSSEHGAIEQEANQYYELKATLCLLELLCSRNCISVLKRLVQHVEDFSADWAFRPEVLETFAMRTA